MACTASDFAAIVRMGKERKKERKRRECLRKVFSTHPPFLFPVNILGWNIKPLSMQQGKKGGVQAAHVLCGTVFKSERERNTLLHWVSLFFGFRLGGIWVEGRFLVGRAECIRSDAAIFGFWEAGQDSNINHSTKMKIWRNGLSWEGMGNRTLFEA